MSAKILTEKGSSLAPALFAFLGGFGPESGDNSELWNVELCVQTGVESRPGATKTCPFTPVDWHFITVFSRLVRQTYYIFVDLYMTFYWRVMY